MAFESFRGRQIAPTTLSQETDTSYSQIHRWIASGEIVATKLGSRCTRVDGDSVAEFFERRQKKQRLNGGG